MHLPDILPSHSPQFSEQLERRTNEILSSIVKENYNTQFAQTASELAEFRHATTDVFDGMDDNALFQSFRKMVQFTTYDSYSPLLARFFEKPCKQSAVVDLFSRGIPYFLVESSSTSGGVPKWFPRYNGLGSQIRTSDSGSPAISTPRRRTHALLCSFGLSGKIHVQDKEHSAITIYLAYSSVQRRRIQLHLDPEEDEAKMGTFSMTRLTLAGAGLWLITFLVLDHTAPYAVGFIRKWRSFLLMHALFALGSRSLETVFTGFITSFVEMMRYLDMEFDTIVDCIATGTIPDLDGIADVRHYLELNISPDPERAAELRNLGRPSSRPGWCGHVWPNLRSVTAIASGAFASSVSSARCFLGPNVAILSLRYSSSEAVIGWPYDPLELNQYKVNRNEIIEFLDINKSDSISDLAQLWEVELGRRYEVVLTTRDGLWRYRLGDVVEIAGFDPADGVPIIRYVERRNVAIRFKDIMISETGLRAVILSAIPSTSVKIVDWTATIDDRRLPTTIAFFVELFESGDQVPDLAFATQRALDTLLSSDANVVVALADELFRKPTIRLVQPGTFSEFRQLKLDEGSYNLGQIKVPVVLPKPKYAAWFADRVVREL